MHVAVLSPTNMCHHCPFASYNLMQSGAELNNHVMRLKLVWILLLLALGAAVAAVPLTTVSHDTEGELL